MSSENTVTDIFKNSTKRMVDIVDISNKDLKGKWRLKMGKKMRESVQEVQPHKTLSSRKNKPRKSMELLSNNQIKISRNDGQVLPG